MQLPMQAPCLPDASLLAGIAAYRRHIWRRDLADPPAIWAEGDSRLLDYGSAAPADDRPVVVFVPSLVNRAHVLDLLEGHSMLRFLAEAGVRSLLLDWGWPGEVEQRFSLTDYVAGRLERAIASLGRKIILAGYCMGGLMAVAAAQRRPDLIHKLVLLATPWDFHAADQAAARRIASLLPSLEPGMAASGTLSVDALQVLFSMAEPGAVAAKYRSFGKQDQATTRSTMFVAIEDWLNDGIPLAAPVARETLAGWYGANTPVRGEWRIAGEAIRPEGLRLPAFVALPSRDRIVPPESALALAGLIPGAVQHVPAAGHVGMVAGSKAKTGLWKPLAAWLKSAHA